MRKPVAVSILSLLACSLILGSDSSFGGIQLLNGYSATRGSAIDATSWTIRGKDGFVIHFESGPSEGQAIKARTAESYSWTREQRVNGYRVLVALVKPGVKTDQDLDKERGLPPGNILIVTFLLGEHPDHAANFVAKVANEREIVDALLMALTFDPSKGLF